MDTNNHSKISTWTWNVDVQQTFKQRITSRKIRNTCTQQPLPIFKIFTFVILKKRYNPWLIFQIFTRFVILKKRNKPCLFLRFLLGLSYWRNQQPLPIFKIFARFVILKKRNNPCLFLRFSLGLSYWRNRTHISSIVMHVYPCNGWNITDHICWPILLTIYYWPCVIRCFTRTLDFMDALQWCMGLRPSFRRPSYRNPKYSTPFINLKIGVK